MDTHILLAFLFIAIFSFIGGLLFDFPNSWLATITRRQIIVFIAATLFTITSGAAIYFLPKLCISLAVITFFYLLTFSLLKAASRH